MSTVDSLKKKISSFPDSPGVYTFVDKKGETLYIGKATSLKDRVKSYFNDDVIATRGRRIVDMVAGASDIEVQPTASVLEALILEANLIKKHEPKYNAKEKDNKSFNSVVITKEKFPQVLIVRERTRESEFDTKDIKYTFGPFTSGSSLRTALTIIRKMFPYRDNKCVPAEDMIKKGKQPRPCFNRQIGLCPGVCTGEITAQEYARTIRHLQLFFEGKKGQLIKTLEREMNAAARDFNFEEAHRIKKTIFSLDHINDVALLRHDISDTFSGSSDTVRIEAYDIAHLSGTNTVGVMVAIENGIAKKSDYRKFRIKALAREVHDPKNLAQVLTRRLGHTEWPLPTLIVVDGNEIQINAAETVLREQGKTIPVVSVVKDSRHKAREIRGEGKLIEQFQRAILLANAEAHRFAIAYHRQLRSKQYGR